MKFTSFAIFAAACFGALAVAQAKGSHSDSNAVRLHIDVDRDVLPADTTEKAVVRIGLDGFALPAPHDRPPINLAMVIDRSGSMSGPKIAHAREAALEAVRRLGPDDIVALIAYDTTVETLVPAQRMGNGRQVEDAIRRIEAGGNTALYDGVSRGAAELRRHVEDHRYVNRIILLSDGLANVGPSSAVELGRLGAALVKEGISVSTVGVGLGFNEDLMTQLAQRSDGNTYFVQESSELPAIFAAELGDVLSVVARRVVIQIDFPSGVRPVCFVGRDGSIRGQTAELTLNQIYGGQQKFALVEVQVAPTAAGVERELARARVSYLDAVSQRAATVESARTVRFSSNQNAVVASANLTLQADYAANSLAVAKDEAIALVDAGKRDGAAALLRQRAAELNALGVTYRNTAVQKLAAPAGAEADQLARDGLDNAKRKAIRAESMQVRNQQGASSAGSDGR